MGKLLSKSNYASIQPNRTLLHCLKQKKIQTDIFDCLSIIYQCYPTHTTLTLDEFEDIFSGMIDEGDTTELFIQLQLRKDPGGYVDIFESLAALVILSGDNFENKLEFIFKLFDFDKSETIELKELTMSIQACVRGLSKFTGMPLPTLLEIDLFTEHIFK